MLGDPLLPCLALGLLCSPLPMGCPGLTSESLAQRAVGEEVITLKVVPPRRGLGKRGSVDTPHWGNYTTPLGSLRIHTHPLLGS